MFRYFFVCITILYMTFYIYCSICLLFVVIVFVILVITAAIFL